MVRSLASWDILFTRGLCAYRPHLFCFKSNDTTWTDDQDVYEILKNFNTYAYNLLIHTKLADTSLEASRGTLKGVTKLPWIYKKLHCKENHIGSVVCEILRYRQTSCYSYIKLIVFSGVGFRPLPHNKDIESTLIWFRHGDDNGSWKTWVERLEKFLEVTF